MALWTMSNEGQQFTSLQFEEAVATPLLPSIEFTNTIPPAVAIKPGVIGEMFPLEFEGFSSRIKRVRIYITPSSTMDQTPASRMYRKTAMHEIGHFLGLGDNIHLTWLQQLLGEDPVSGTSGSTVMNWPSGKADPDGWQPPHVTACDSQRVKGYF